MVEFLNEKMTQSDFGLLVGVSQQAISALVVRGILDPEMVAGDMLIAYCAHLREVAAGRATGGELDLSQERAGLARESKIKLALQNATTRKELVPVQIITSVLAQVGASASGLLATIPGNIRRRVPDLSVDEIEKITEEVGRVQNMIAAIKISDLKKG